MKKFSKNILIAVCSFIVCLTFAASGCADGDDGKPENGGIVSYVSQQTEVYSSTAEVVEAVADTVVEISTETVTTQWGMQYIVSGAGSGVIVGKNEENNLYYIVTNNHVIDGAKEISVTTRSGKKYAASLVAADDSADIAVIAVTSEVNLKIAVWGDSDRLKIGEDLIAIGNPLGSLGGTVTKGILSAKGRSITVGNYAMTLLQTDTAINPGNSGGGLFNMRGQLIGVVNAKTTDEEIEGICFAIPANTARSVYGDLVQYGYINGRATLGIMVEQLTFRNSHTIVCVTDAGNSPDGTFMRYDGIYSVNGKRISTILEFNVALSEINVGDSVEIEVYRGTASHGILGSVNISFASELTKFSVNAVQYGA